MIFFEAKLCLADQLIRARLFGFKRRFVTVVRKYDDGTDNHYFEFVLALIFVNKSMKFLSNLEISTVNFQNSSFGLQMMTMKKET